MISRGNQEGRLYPISIQNITNWIRFANVMIWCSVSPSCTTFGASPLFSASNYGTTSRTLRRRKPYHRSNCVFMTTIRKIIDNHSRWLETTSACKTQHTTTLSRDHNHNTQKTFLRYARWRHYQKMELLGRCTEILQSPPLFILGMGRNSWAKREA